MKIILTLLLTTVIFTVYSQCSHTLSFAITETSCSGDDGIVVITVSGGNGPFTYDHNNGPRQTSNIFNNVPHGSQIFTAWDAANCPVQATPVLVSPVSIVSLTSTPTCKDYLAGTINIIGANGDHTYEYSTDGGITWTGASPIQGLDQGSYNFVIRDGLGCTESSTISVGYSSMDPIITTTSELCDGTLGSLNVNFPNAGNYNYTIDGGVTTETAISHSYSLTGGNYLFTATNNDDNCVETINVEVDIDSIHGQITNQINETCNYVNGEVLVTASDGVAPVNYSIDDGANFTSSGYFGNLDDGTYYIEVTDARSCIYRDTLEITNTGGVVLNLSIDTSAICFGSFIDIVSNTSLPNCTYQWDNSLGTDTAVSVSPATTTDYRLIIEEPNGCKDTAYTHIIVNPIPVVTLSLNQVNLCTYDSVLVTASGADTYSWTTGETTSSIYLKQPYNESYIVATGTSLGCPNKDSIVVNVSDVNAQISADQTICEGNTANLSVNATGSNLTYQWSVGTSTTNTQNVSPTLTTTYQVVVTDFTTCTDTVETTVFVDPLTDLEVSPTSVLGCIGDEVTLTATGATDYLWNTTETSSEITFIINGNQTMSVLGENGVCNDEVNIQIVAKPSPSVVASSNLTTTQIGNPVIFDNTGSNASYTEWRFGDGTTSVMDNPSHSYNFDGVYNVVLTGYIGQCEDKDSLIIYVGTVGIEDKTTFEYSIYPNPSSGIFNINLSLSQQEDVSLSVYNINGKQIKTYNSKNTSGVNLNYDFSSLSRGVYLVELIIKDERIIKKIILN